MGKDDPGAGASPAEARLWTLLSGPDFARDDFRQRHVIGPFAVDFASPTHKLVIDLDDPNGEPRQATINGERAEYLGQRGWRVLRIANAQVLSAPDDVVRAIKVALKS